MRVASGVHAVALFIALAQACGGKSIRHLDEAIGGEPDDPPPTERGGAPNGGRGGNGAVGPNGGVSTSGTFTGGTGTGGTFPVGGTGAGGTGFGGTPATGGTGIAGSISTGGTGIGGCSTTAELPAPSVLEWGPNGWIPPTGNPWGISGAWYTFDDCNDASLAGLPCTRRDPGTVGPDGPGWFAYRNGVCARGTVVRVELGPDGQPAYGLQWGFGIGFSLNQGAPYDAASHCIRGFSFELRGNAPPTVRINVVTPKTIGIAHFTETALSLNSFVDFGAVQQGFWVTTPTLLDTTQITDIQFHVYTDDVAPKPFDFCIQNVRVLR